MEMPRGLPLKENVFSIFVVEPCVTENPGKSTGTRWTLHGGYKGHFGTTKINDCQSDLSGFCIYHSVKKLLLHFYDLIQFTIDTIEMWYSSIQMLYGDHRSCQVEMIARERII